ncbi:MAG: hypothetical protein H0T18_03085 [Chloroflexia bacterium]|nr:hypothetical protein [Chloroflexia bacterium]
MVVRTMMRLCAALLLFFVGVSDRSAAQEATPTAAVPTLSDLTDIEQFQDLFNAQAGKPRVILLISPT